MNLSGHVLARPYHIVSGEARSAASDQRDSLVTYEYCLHPAAAIEPVEWRGIYGGRIAICKGRRSDLIKGRKVP